MSKKRGILLFVICMICFMVMPENRARAAKGFYFRYKKVAAVPGKNAEKFLKKAGKPNKKERGDSCLTDGYDYIYEYDSFRLSTYTEEKSEDAIQFVSSIELTSDQVKTPEGVKIGSPEKTVKKKYKHANKKYGIYTKVKNHTKIVITIKRKKVAGIMICGE